MLKCSLGGASLTLMFCVTGLPSMILVSNPAAPTPAGNGTGLTTKFYNFGPTTPGFIANADAVVATYFSTPSITFNTLTPVFPSGLNTAGVSGVDWDASTMLNNFVGANGNNFVPTAGAMTESVTNSYFVMTGFISVTSGQVIDFSLYSDDGSLLTISGQRIINDDGDHAYVGGVQLVSFANVMQVSIASR